MHSALTLPTALLIAAILAGAVKAALIISTLKMALYVARKVARRRQGLDIRPLATVLRISLLAAGSIWLALNPGQVPLAALLLVTASELVDRLEYYDELEISTPASMMLDDLGERAA